MTSPTESYLKVQYELRPAKQVERRMLIDAFQLLAQSGFHIRDYQYTGMGSVYFVDFSLIHRLLGVSKMLSVEYDVNIRKRVEFNKPFSFVETKISPIGDVIPTLSRDLQHILWLDYDGIIRETHLGDLTLAAAHLSTGSLLLMTVDIEPSSLGEPAKWFEHLKDEGGEYFDPTLKEGDCRHSDLARRHIDLIDKAIMSGLSGRNVQFIPLFNFVYKDGHAMLTVGGMIGTQTEKRKIASGGLTDAAYYRSSLKEDPCIIYVPRLTKKERQFLDACMPIAEGWTPADFEMKSEYIEAYKSIYRFCPSYAELLM